MPIFDTRLTPELIERYTHSGHWGTETFYQILAAGGGPPGPGGDHRSASAHLLWAASCRC